MTREELASGDVRLVPLAAADADELRRIRRTPEVERWWDPVEPEFPLEDEPEATRYTVTLDDRVVGMVQYGEELEPKYRSASIDIFLDPAVHGRGVGSTAVRLLAEPPLGARPPPAGDRPRRPQHRGRPRLREGRFHAGRDGAARRARRLQLRPVARRPAHGASRRPVEPRLTGLSDRAAHPAARGRAASAPHSE